MVEITNIWLDLVSDARNSKPDLTNNNGKDKNRILRKSEESALSKQCSSIVQSIGQLKCLLLENRDAYIMGEVGGGKGMSQSDMDTIDASADHICLKCSELIQSYNKIILKTKLSEGGQEHYQLVASGLKDYLKKVLSIHSEMKAVRVKRQVQLTSLSKLEVNSRESRSNKLTLPNSSGSVNSPATSSKSSPRGGGGSKTSLAELQEKSFSASATKRSKVWDSSDEDEALSPEEAQMLEQENNQLIEQLNQLHNQVDQTASKVLKISELQEIFSEKVLQQSSDVEQIHALAVSTTENVKEGNEAVRQAIQNQASYRVIVLFVLLVFSFSLLFLDWYND